MKFQIDLKIFIFAILFCLTKQIEIYSMMMIFAMIHELGHLLAGILMGMKPEKLQIKPYGFSISFKLNIEDYNTKVNKGNLLAIKKIIVALAGPLTNIIIIIIALNLNINIFKVIMIIYINLVLIIFNILPIYPLDGGRILKGVLHIFFGKVKANKYIMKISYYTLIILTIGTSIAILYVKNIALVIGLCVLWIIFLREYKKYKIKSKIYNLINEERELH